MISHAKCRNSLVRQLRAAGCQLTTAETPDEGLEAYRQLLGKDCAPFAIILERSCLPHDGHWLAIAIRDFGIPPPALVMLCDVLRDEPGADSAIVDLVINKPAKTSLLLSGLQKLIFPRVDRVVFRTEPSAPARIFANVRVLLADDNLVNQKVATRLLQRLGIEVVCVGNGCEALDALRRGDFDVVLMDCQMPEMDGYEATRQLRQSRGEFRNALIPVIALTAHAMAADRDKCIAAGMNEYLSKPIDALRLQQVIARTLCPDTAMRANGPPPKHDRSMRRLRPPETFNFLGFTHICGRSRRALCCLPEARAVTDCVPRCGRCVTESVDGSSPPSHSRVRAATHGTWI